MKVAIFILLLFFFEAWGAEAHLIKNGAAVDIKISEVDLPASQFEKDFKSGLTTSLVTTLSLSKNQKVLEQRSVEYKIRYDLWDECFYILQNENPKPILKSKAVQEIFAALKTFVFPSMATIADLGRHQVLAVDFVITANPVSKDKKEKIKKWLAQNQVSIPQGGASRAETRLQVTEAPTSPTGQRLFQQLLDSELNQIESAKWSYRLPTKTLLTEEIRHEK